MGLRTEWVLRWIDATSRALEDNKPLLTELDSVIGDGDHGENLARGFAAVDQKLSSLIVETPRQALRTTGVILLASVGGAAGPLYGTAFLRAAKAIPKDALELGPQDVAMMLVKAAEGIAERGGCQPGDKTMLDAWYPAATNAAAAVAKGVGAAEVLQIAAEAALSGADGTLSMSAAKGRASLLGERSIGHKDPGAISTAMILSAAATSAVGLDGGSNFGESRATGSPNVWGASAFGGKPKGMEVNLDESPTETGAVVPEVSSPAPTSPATATPPDFGLYQDQAHSFQTAAMRLLADDEPEPEAVSGAEPETAETVASDISAGDDIAAALGIGIAMDESQESTS